MPAEAFPVTQGSNPIPPPQLGQRWLPSSSLIVFAGAGLVLLALPFLTGSPRLAICLAASILTTASLVVAVLPWRLRTFREASASARSEHARFLAAAENTLDDFYIFDGVPDTTGAIVDFRFSYINPNAERRLGVPRESLYGKILTEVRPFMIRSGLIEQYREVVRTGAPYSCEVFIDDDMIQGTWLNVQVVKLGNGVAITSRDVTEHRRRSEHIHYLAHHDHLTGLANRTLLYERLRLAIARAEELCQSVAIFVLDIDNFKQINDSLGHADGDLLLATVGQRLLASVRESDTVARLGGDEFVIVMPDFRSIEDVERCGRQIIRNAAQPLTIAERSLSITVSVGIAIYPDAGLTAQDLLRSADAAMYAVKDSGRNSLRIYSDDMMDSRRPTLV
jgi:diguanylate cyclase (GGDEF)-like protein